MRSKLRKLSKPFFAALCVAAFSLYVVLLAQTGTASAEMRNSDLLAGKVVGERTLTLAQQIDITAPYACLIDSTGSIYFERDAHTKVKIASITKVMTAILALEYGELTDELTVNHAAATIGESSAYLEEGDVLTLRAALAALLVPSGNDAAVAIAEYIGAIALAKHVNLGAESSTIEDPAEAFVALMNVKAQELGLNDTTFRNPHGLDDGYYEGDQGSTAYDVALMVKYAMQKQTFRDIVASSGGSITVKRNDEEITLTLQSTDWFIETYDYAIGVKTGSTDYAGYCFAGAANYNGLEVYSVVLGCASDTDRFQDSTVLCNWAIAHHNTFNLYNSTETVTYVSHGETVTNPLFAEIAHVSWVDKTYKAVMISDTDVLDVFDIDGNVCQKVEFYSIEGNVSIGDSVGKVYFMQRNEVIYEADLVAAEDSAAPNMFQAIGVWFQRLIRTFQGQPTVALTQVYNTPERIIDREA